MTALNTSRIALALSASAFGTSCLSSDDVQAAAALIAAADCTAAVLQPTAETLDAIMTTLSTTTSSGAFTAMFTVGGVDFTVNGSTTVNAGDISDGFDPGDNVTVTWTLSSTGNASGNGSFDVDYQAPTLILATGSGTLMQDTCVFVVSATNLSIDPSNPNADVTGTINFQTTDDGGSPMVGTITFDGTNIAVVNVMFEGDSHSFNIDLNDFTASF